MGFSAGGEHAARVTLVMIKVNRMRPTRSIA